MPKNLLWEIGTEELPARFVKPALENLSLLAKTKLNFYRLDYEELKTAGTYRRLVLFVKNLSERQKELEEEVLGPPVSVGEEGKIGFAKKYGVPPEELIIKDTKKGQYFCLKRKILGEETFKILPEILKEILLEISFPKTMRWKDYEIRFARPIRWMLCLFGDRVVPLELANIRASNITQGHRFLTKEPLKLDSAAWETYEEVLAKNWVIVDPNKRLEKTKEEILKIGEKVGYPQIELELLEENANLVEYPFPILGSFPEEFLKLPEPLVITALKEHQRYFCLRDGEGKLLPYFVAVNNNLAKNMEVVKKGHERVTKARLEDAKFYYERDLKEPLEKKVEKLKGIVYHINCGTLWDKTQRLVKLGLFIAKKIDFKEDLNSVEKACYFSKADLASEVVKEFPSLQGVIGKIYTEYFGYSEIAKAIFEQYLPSPKDESLPETFEGICLSLADKIDHLGALFGIGEKPTGESDPYALRRTAYGIIKILIGKEIFLNLEEIVNFGLELLKSQNFLIEENALSEILTFLRRRLESEFLSLNVEKNLIFTVINLPLNPYEIFLKLKAIRDFQEKQEFQDLITGFKRAYQILKSVEVKNLPELKVSLLTQPQEKALFQLLEKVKPELSFLSQKRDYHQYLEKLLSFKEPIDQFFDHVFVMVEDETLKLNRLRLLAEVVFCFNQLGDFSYLV
ncbi:MAG: glycine--tRNA ligase subunit beta [Thermodesulfobacteriaceae bacterium]|nr:glycine--tRNA ligase subunit beta [Thermodesulfobacteriaceae bacterium]MCX8041986.1 glycine--tRNA ligase subunit beta [Thermodesulfobacteriaceae bacterium]MDW8136397.1 glycine--tRNA ligase subunit beta [Thermodesulfobacterium sp.]